jgi:hypothetical protein
MCDLPHRTPIRLEQVFSYTRSSIIKVQSLSGDERARTAGLLLAKQALCQLSYIPAFSH